MRKARRRSLWLPAFAGMTRWGTIVIVAATAFGPRAVCANVSPVIAVVQDEAKWDIVNSVRSGVRLAFRRQNAEWIPVCRDMGSVDWNRECAIGANSSEKWHVALHGRAIGELKTRRWLETDAYSGIGLLKIVGGEIPRAGLRSLEFAGWGDVPVQRPLVASNRPLAWRMRWRDSYPADVPAAPLFTSMRKLIPTIPVCRKTGDGSGKVRPLVAADIHVVEIWKASGGERLFGASLRPERVKPCDYDFELVTDVWFYDDGKSGPLALPALFSSEAAHRIIDIGDFGDGREEALFWLSGYDEDGYVLLYDGFKKSARFTWSYH